MAVIDKLLIYVKTRASFDTKLAAGEFATTSLIFIEDSGEIWTHGKFYASADAVAEDLTELKADVLAILKGEKLSGADAIVITTSSDPETTLPSVSLKIKDADSVLSQSTEGLFSTITLEKIAVPAEGFASQYKLTGVGGAQLGVTIDLAKDQFLKSADFIASATQDDVDIDISVVIGDPYLKFVFQTVGVDTTSYVAVKALVDVYTAGNGITITGNVISANVKAGDAYLESTADGLATKGIAEIATGLTGLSTKVGDPRVGGDTPAEPTGIFKIIEDNEKVVSEALVDLNARVGVPKDTDVEATGVYKYVDDTIAEAAGDVTELVTKVTALETSVGVITGEATVVGSIAKAQADAQAYADSLLVWAEIE